MKHNNQLFYTGISCRRWRLSMGYSVSDVTNDTGYSATIISRFERGTTNNMALFLWYLARGFNPDRDFIDPKDRSQRLNAQQFFERTVNDVDKL